MIKAPAASTARNAVWRRCFSESGAVVAMKIGATPTGSMITVSVTNVVPIASHCIAGAPYARSRRSNRRRGGAGLVAVEGEVHVVLRIPRPAAAPAPADGRERRTHLCRDHAPTVAGTVAVGLRLRIAAHAAADVRVLDRVEVNREAVGVIGPATGAAAAAARRRDRLPALEGTGGIAIRGAVLRVDGGDRHVMDREVDHVEAVEDLRQRRGRALVHDQLTAVVVLVEAAVGDPEDPQVAERNRAALVEGAGLRHLGADGVRHGLDRRVERCERADDGADDCDADHAPILPPAGGRLCRCRCSTSCCRARAPTGTRRSRSRSRAAGMSTRRSWTGWSPIAFSCWAARSRTSTGSSTRLRLRPRKRCVTPSPATRGAKRTCGSSRSSGGRPAWTPAIRDISGQRDDLTPHTGGKSARQIGGASTGG